MLRVDRTARVVSVLALLWASLAPSVSSADLATSPAWFNAAWHYRVPITIPASAAVSSTVVLNVDFNALLAQLGIASGSVDFDENSPRVVRPNGSTATRQEFTDVVYNSALDAANNGRGEVRFLMEDAPGAGTYYLYFDIVGNGAKAANPATPINGNFEQSAGSVPTGWVTSSVNANGAQNNEVYRTALGSTVTVAAGCQTTATSVSTSPNAVGGVATGQAWHLLGYRTNCEDGNGNRNELIQLSRDIAVPSGAAAGNLTFYFQVQGWDGITNATNYDWVVFYVNGTAVTHTSLGINNSTAPQLVIEAGRLGRNNYSTTYLDHGWKLATLNLSAYAGTTINFRIETHHYTDNDYRSWVKIDDVAWSVQNGSVGTPQAFGANVTRPNDTSAGAASVLTAGQPVAVRVAVDATASSVRADIYNQSGTLVASNRQLFDDGTHGDAASGDRIFTNDGSVAAQPTYTILATDPPGTAWKVRAFAYDASVSSVGAPNGLIQRPGQPASPVNQTNYFNVDEQIFTVTFTTLSVTKTLVTRRDPVNGTTLPKAVPDAWVQYQLTVVNQGPGAIDANTVVVVDALSANTAMCVTTACSGAASAVTYDDSTSPVPTGLTFTYATNVTYSNNNGVTYTYTPVPDANGFDSAVTRVRIAPSGAMNAPGVGGQPRFVLRYVVRVK